MHRYTVTELKLSRNRGWVLDAYNWPSGFPYQLWDAAQAALRKGLGYSAYRIVMTDPDARGTLIHLLYVPAAGYAGVTFWGRRARWIKVDSTEEAVEDALRCFRATRREQQVAAVAV